jgi:hypothetical protein
MLLKLTKYLLKLKDSDDVRETILQDFYLQDLADMRKYGDRLINDDEIKACLLKARDDQQHKMLKLSGEAPLGGGSPPKNVSGSAHKGDADVSFSEEEDCEIDGHVEVNDGVVGELGELNRHYSRRFGNV